jgi:protoporphyrin/coproporphyrin ferrochelatase
MSVYGAQTANAPKFDNTAKDYDAVLVVSFGGPEGMDDVMPFLENVLRGRNVPRERMIEVSHHYEMFGGVSPINAQNSALIAELEAELKAHDIDLPIYFGNRNWHPMIPDTLRQMRDDGVKKALAFFTSAFSCYSGCRQYRENLQAAIEEIGEGAPEIDKIRVFYNHPGFIGPNVENVQRALQQWPEDERANVHIAFTAHSIPMGMAKNSQYEAQLTEACRLVAEQLGTDNYKLVYQSRSGPPQMPWLEPDIVDYMEEIHAQGVNDLVILPIGFISDHMEVMFDLDTEAVEKADELGIKLVRAASVGTHPDFVSMIRELIVERMSADPLRRALGSRGPNHDVCPLNCCLPGASRRPQAASQGKQA